ncbi:MAG: hypothetical protein NVS4B3_28780 [Gemmatimonadaceae bacterium]
MAPPKPGDMRAGYIGLIAGALGIGAVLYSMVQLTKLKYERQEPTPLSAAPK